MEKDGGGRTGIGLRNSVQARERPRRGVTVGRIGPPNTSGIAPGCRDGLAHRIRILRDEICRPPILMRRQLHRGRIGGKIQSLLKPAP